MSYLISLHLGNIVHDGLHDLLGLHDLHGFHNLHDLHDTGNVLELAEFRKYSTDWVLQKFEEPCRLYKKYVNVNVNVDVMMI